MKVVTHASEDEDEDDATLMHMYMCNAKLHPWFHRPRTNITVVNIGAAAATIGTPANFRDYNAPLHCFLFYSATYRSVLHFVFHLRIFISVNIVFSFIIN